MQIDEQLSYQKSLQERHLIKWNTLGQVKYGQNGQNFANNRQRFVDYTVKTLILCRFSK